MSDWDIAKKRRSMEYDISVYRFCIKNRYTEIDDFNDKIARLQQRLVALAEFEQQLHQDNMVELLRLCQTPCRRYLPRDE